MTLEEIEKAITTQQPVNEEDLYRMVKSFPSKPLKTTKKSISIKHCIIGLYID